MPRPSPLSRTSRLRRFTVRLAGPEVPGFRFVGWHGADLEPGQLPERIRLVPALGRGACRARRGEVARSGTGLRSSPAGRREHSSGGPAVRQRGPARGRDHGDPLDRGSSGATASLRDRARTRSSRHLALPCRGGRRSNSTTPATASHAWRFCDCRPGNRWPRCSSARTTSGPTGLRRVTTMLPRTATPSLAGW